MFFSQEWGSSLESLALVSSATPALIGFSDASRVGYWLLSSPTLNKTSLLCK